MGDASVNIIDRSGRRRLPVGTEDFEIVVDRYTYIDKTRLAVDLVDKSYGGTTLFCRPRRFGKSLAMRMLQCFFEVPVEGYVADRAGLFDGMAVTEDAEAMAERAAHPVVYLSLNGVDGGSWEDAEKELVKRVAVEVNRHYYLLDSPVLNAPEKASLRRLAEQRPEGADLTGSLALLSRLLHRHHGSRTAILIDEYDYPVMAGHLGGYREEAVGFEREWLTESLKATTDLFLGVLTGVQRISRESIFSQLNNIKVNTALDVRYSEGFGFTADEAEALAFYLGADAHISEMREWYDGYCFGGTDVYNPWSVLNYLDERVGPRLYWGNTSSNAIVHDLVQHASAATAADLSELADGGVLRRVLRLDTVFDELDRPESIWSQLYLAGYVTTDDIATSEWDERTLRVPNREVGMLYKREFVERAQGMAGGEHNLRELHAALVSGDGAAFGRSMERVLLDSPSYHDLQVERDYQNLLVGLLYSVSGYRPARANREAGDGRADVLVEPNPDEAERLPAICIECKRLAADDAPKGADELRAALEALAAEGLCQARERRYADGLAGSGAFLWGAAFCGKRAAAACERA